MEFGRSIEYSIGKEPYTRGGGGANAWIFSKKSKLRTSLDQQSEILYNMLL